MENPLFVTDSGVAELPFFDRIVASVKTAGLEPHVFDDVSGNPTAELVHEGCGRFESERCDGVVAVGGGSSLDVGKAIAFMSGHDEEIWNYAYDADPRADVDADAVAPTIAVPTTAGTGSALSPSAVIAEPDSHRKRSISDQAMVPDVVIADPRLTIGMPPELTAWVGMDALSHNLEAYCAPAFHPMADGIALEGVRLVEGALVKAVEEGDDIGARSRMMAASLMGAAAFSKGLGAVHALSHPISAHFGTHHGRTNAVLLPYVVELNLSATRDKLRRLARYLALNDRSAAGLVRWLVDLREELGIAHTLAEIGVEPDDELVDRLAKSALEDVNAASNPVKLTREKSASVYRRAMDGDFESFRIETRAADG